MQISEKERKAIASFLQWNDSNGTYMNLNKRDILKLFFDSINEDFFEGYEDKNSLSYGLSQIKKIAKDKNVYFSTTVKLGMLLRYNNIETYRKIVDMA